MLRQLGSAAAVALAAAFLHSADAAATKVAWNVSIGGPGYAINVGEPGYWGGHPGYRGPHAYRPWVRPGVAVPLWLPPAYPAAGYVLPSPYAAPYPAPYATSYPVHPTVYDAYPIVAPRVVAIPVPAPIHVHRRVVVPAPLLRPPVHGRPYY
jgi:hypothetical protein